MKYLIKTLCTSIATAFLFACSSGNGGFDSSTSTSTSTSTTGIINARNFSIGFDNFDPDVIKFSAEPTISSNGIVDTTAFSILSSHDGVDVKITVTAGDRNNIKVTSGTVNFKTQYGLLSATSCEIDSTGTCTITWSSLSNIDYLLGTNTVDVYNDITAWTYGEETFIDSNGNGIYDDTEANNVFTDVEEPFVDLNTSGSYDAGETLFDIDSNGTHTSADSQYNGSNCTRSDNICAGATLIPIFRKGRIDLSFE